MRNDVRFIGLLLLATAMFGQHAGGARGGSATRFAHAGGQVLPSAFARQNVRFSSHRLRFGQRFGFNAFAPYYPFIGDYADDLSVNAYPPGNDSFTVQPNLPPIALPFPPPTAHAVIEEYEWKTKDVAGAGDQATFTIALKDGSRRYPVTTWVQNGKLYFIDSEGGQEVLTPDRIDRDTTQRLNNDRNLHMQLPPG